MLLQNIFGKKNIITTYVSDDKVVTQSPQHNRKIGCLRPTWIFACCSRARQQYSAQKNSQKMYVNLNQGSEQWLFPVPSKLGSELIFFRSKKGCKMFK